jgi:hypothetical protein
MSRLPQIFAFVAWSMLEWPLDAALRSWLPDVVVKYPSVPNGEVPPTTDIFVDLRRPLAGALLLLGLSIVVLAQRREVRTQRSVWSLAFAMMTLGFVHYLLFQAGPWTFALLEGFGLPLSRVPAYFSPLEWNPYRFLELPMLLSLLLVAEWRRCRTVRQG